MAVRAVWRPPWYAWVALGIAALASTHVVIPRLLRGHWLMITPLLVFVGVLALRKLWELPPAVAMCGAIVLTIFSGAWRLIGLGGLPFDRLLIVIVLLQILLRAPGTAQMPRVQIRNVHLLMALTVLFAVGSAIAAGTLSDEASLLSLVDQFGIAPYLMFLVAPAVFAGERERKMLLATLVGLGAYLGFTAIFESLGPHALVFPHYITQVDTELPGERAGGPFQSSVAEGFATFACAVAALMAFIQWHGQRRRYLAAAVVGVCIFGCFLTLERGVWIGAVAATIITALLTRSGRRWLVPGLLACAVVVGVPLAVSSGLTHKTSNRATDQLSVWARQNQTSAGLRMLAAKPLLGFGWGRYTTDSLEYFRQASDYPLSGYVLGEEVGSANPPLPLHDTYLAFAVELGLIGALLWLASLLWGVGGAVFSRGAPALKPWKLGLMAILVFYLVVSFLDPHEQAFPVLLLWSWGGVAFGCPPLTVQAQQAKAALAKRLRPVWTPA
jgi:putative inorganic carbon (HCO3(-)) transporter